MQFLSVSGMLARHLLFLAARRPHSALLAIPAESVPPVQQPPPYVGPPRPHNQGKVQQYDACAREQHHVQQAYGPNYSRQQDDSHDQRQRPYPRETYLNDRQDSRSRQQFFEDHSVPNYPQNQQICGSRDRFYVENFKEQQFRARQGDGNQQFYTLPSRRPQREVEAPRSVTPDITRGLGRGPLSAMHMMARQGQKLPHEQTGQFHTDAQQMNLKKRSAEQLDSRSRPMQNQQQQAIDMRSRIGAPLGLTAMGYRFFASSPVYDLGRNSPTRESLKHTPISPIGPGHSNSFKASTPTGRSTPTVAERLAMTTNKNTPDLGPTGRNTTVQSSSGRSTPTNLILSPTKSTMSNEELFAAIHKSKKRLNIRDDGENVSPCGSMNSLVQSQQVGTRHSWSPESQKIPEVPQTIQSPSATSRLDFKRLLLQQSVKTGPTRLSAAEQLKLSRQQCQMQQQSQHSTQQAPPVKVLSPRSAWRFQTPRTDVLSSTIIEDAAAEEKAMKPSPENTSPISRLNSRKQLDLCSDLPAHLDNKYCEDNGQSRRDERLSIENLKEKNHEVNWRMQAGSDNARQVSTLDNRMSEEGVNVLTGQRAAISQSQNIMNNFEKHRPQYLHNSPQITSSCSTPINTSESRRMNNQLARSQFLAGMPVIANQGQKSYFQKQYRARSESPQHAIAQNVTRSPSAPTLETAL